MGEDFHHSLGVYCCYVARVVDGLSDCWVLAVALGSFDVSWIVGLGDGRGDGGAYM